jgi:hypothetical protein
MLFIVSVAVLLYFLISLEHRDNMRHGGVAECGKVEMYDHEGAEENPEAYMDKNYNLDSADEIHAETEQVRVPEKKAGNQLERYQQNHDKEI